MATTTDGGGCGTGHHDVVLLGGRRSVNLARQLTHVGVEVVVIANTSWDTDGHRPDLGALLDAGVAAVPVTDDPNPTTVVVAGVGELAASEWVSQGAPERLLAVRLAGNAKAHSEALAAVGRAEATVLGPDDADLVIDPILKVLAQTSVHLPRPLLAVAHGHHRFKDTADDMIEICDDATAQAEAILARLEATTNHGADQ